MMLPVIWMRAIASHAWVSQQQPISRRQQEELQVDAETRIVLSRIGCAGMQPSWASPWLPSLRGRHS